MAYAIIRLQGKQYRVSAGERLLVDRLKLDESATFNPDVLFTGGGASDGATVTAKVVGHTLGPKIRIGKYKKRTGYRRHTGYRSRLSEIEIESIGGAKASRSKAAAKPKDDAPKAEETAPKAEAAPKGLPKGYEEMTVADIHDKAKDWKPEQVAAALEYEQANAARKGAMSALESAAGLPDGYAEMTVAQIHDDAKGWPPEQVQAALEYEQAHAARKGAISALESAAEQEEEES
jgi:large subunit ribosomal protein L21